MPCNSRKMVCRNTTDDCLIRQGSKCVTYDGPATTNVGYITNMPLTDLLILIDQAIGNGGGGGGSFINSTPTVLVSGIGSSGNPFTLTARRSTDIGNQLVLGSDNALFVAPPTDSGSGFII